MSRPGPLVRLLVRALVRLYPADFRRRYGAEMRAAHYDAWVEEAAERSAWRRARFWLRASGTVLRAAAELRLGAVARRSHDAVRGLGLHARLALRGLRSSPGFVLLAVVTLGAGIGTTTALSAVARATLVDGLPFPDPDALHRVTALRQRDEPVPWPLSHSDWSDLSARVRTFEGLAVRSGPRSVNLLSDGGPRSVSAEMVSAGYFDVLGVAPALGRTFTAAEDAPPTGQAVAVLSHAIWQASFAGAPEVLGATLRVNDLPYTVVGVMPAGFRGETGAADLWLPIRQAAVIYDGGYVDNRYLRWLTAVGRARDGVTAEAVARDVAEAGRTLAVDFPDANEDLGMRAEPLRDAWFGDLRTPLVALLAGSILALLVVCLNLASVQVSRGLARRRESDVCRALGAPRAALLARWGVEALLLGGAGLAAGLVGAGVLLAYANGPGQAVVGRPVALGWLGVPIAVVLALGAAVVLAVVPSAAARAQGGSVAASMAASGARAGTAGRVTRRGLVVGQVALTTALCMAAVLLATSVRELYRLDLGFDPDGVVAARVDLLGPAWDDDGPKRTLARDLLRALEAEPGAGAAALAGPGGVPTGELYGFYFAVEQDAEPAWMEESELLSYHLVTPGWFDILGVDLLQGRLLDASDDESAPGAAVVTRALAQRFWPDGTALGRRLRMGGGATAPWFTVVGVVADPAFEGRTRSTELEGPEHVFLPFLQEPPSRPARMNLFLSAEGDGGQALPGAARSALATAAPSLPLQEVTPLGDLLEAQTARDRLTVAVSLGFALLALVLAALGVHSVVAHEVRRRRHELGVHLALGARPGAVARMVVGESVGLTGAGLVCGTALAVAGGRYLEGLLFGIAPVYPPGIALVLVIVSASAVLASVGPVRAALATDVADVLTTR